MNELIIIRGVSGSGKTTLAKKLLEIHQADLYFEADQYFVRPDGVYDFNGRMLKNAHAWCFENVKRELLRFPVVDRFPHRIIVSNTFTRIWEMQGYIDLCKEHNLYMKVIRCEGRFDNTHGVPPEKVQEMRDRFEDFAGETIVNNE